MKISLQCLPTRDPAARHLADHPDGSPLFPGGSLGSETAARNRAKVLESWSGDRSALRVWLTEQNGFSALHDAQRRNLEAAGSPDAVFILTGQQPALLGGPALWYCKAMTCASLARDLGEKLGRPVIPLFWAAGDDSDLSECNAVEWLESGAPASALDFPDPKEPVPMSLRMLPKSGMDELGRALRAAWGGEISALVESWYQPGRSVTEAFLRMAQHFLAPEGVLFVDGFSAAGKAQPFLHRLARAAPAFQKAVERGSDRARAAGFKPQVPPRPGSVPAFILEKGMRARLFFSGTEESAKIYVQGSEGRDLLPELKNHRLLHSALSRPLLAEELFPVLGHVLGPTELRYFAQLADAFPAFSMSAPPLAPRQQLSVCSRADWERLAALGFRPEDLPEMGPARLRDRLAKKAWDGHPAAKEFPEKDFLGFASMVKHYQEKFFPGRGLDAGWRRLERAFERYRENARHEAFVHDGAETFASFQSLLRWLGNGMQDRHVNLLSLRNALGAEGFAQLADGLRDPGGEIAVAFYGEEG